MLGENGTVESGYFTVDGYYIEYSNGTAEILSNKEKEQETLKMIDNLNSLISTMGLDSKYGVFHCGLNGSSDTISCHYDYSVKVDDKCYDGYHKEAGAFDCSGTEVEYTEGDLGIFGDVTKTFDLKKYNLNNRQWNMIYFNAKTNKITKATLNSFNYENGKLSTY